jgi:hypothetical protein
MRRIWCLFRGHKWRSEENYATQGTELDCLRCGAHRSIFPGDPNFRSPARPGDGMQDGHSISDGGGGGDGSGF